MPQIGDEPLGVSIEGAASRAKASPRQRRHGLIAHYPAVEDDSMASSPGAWGARRKAGFILAAAALVWGAIFGIISLLR